MDVDDDRNLQVLCSTCNTAKTASDATDLGLHLSDSPG